MTGAQGSIKMNLNVALVYRTRAMKFGTFELMTPYSSMGFGSSYLVTLADPVSQPELRNNCHVQ